MTEKTDGQPQSVDQIVAHGSNRLRDIAAQAQSLQHAESQLQTALPARLHSQWSLSAITPQQLLLITSSATWGTLLRGHQKLLLDKAEALIGHRPKQFKLRIVAPSTSPPKTGAPPMSDATIRYLEGAASGMVDPRLESALSQLAQHGRRLKERD